MGIIATAFFSDTTAQFVLLGAATGALYALVGLGIVLVYRASGVLNFSAGGVGAIAAFVFYVQRDEHGWNWIVALVVALALGALLGALTQFLVMAVLRRVSLLAKLIASLGLMTAAQGFVIVAWGNEYRGQPESIFPTDPVRFTDILVIPQERLILIGIAIALALALRFVYSKTLFGLATSGVAENRRVAATSGWSPSRIELANFMIAGVLSAAAGIFLAPIVGLDGTILTLIVIQSLAAALVGRFSSFGLTVAGALAIGAMSAVLGLFRLDIASGVGIDPSSLSGLQDTVPLFIIIVMTVISGRARLQRGEVLTKLPLPGSGRVRAGFIALGTAIGVLLLFGLPATWNDALITSFGISIVLLSVVVVTGYCGQLSLCQYTLAGFGAWVAARLSATQGLPFELALIIGVDAPIDRQVDLRG